MTTSTLSIRVATLQKDKLGKLAKSTGRSRSFLAADAIREYLDVQDWHVNGIKQAIASLDEHGGINHEDVRAWVASWGQDAMLPPAPRAKKA